MNRRSMAGKALALVSLIPNDTFDIWRGLGQVLGGISEYKLCLC